MGRNTMPMALAVVLLAGCRGQSTTETSTTTEPSVGPTETSVSAPDTAVPTSAAGPSGTFVMVFRTHAGPTDEDMESTAQLVEERLTTADGEPVSSASITWERLDGQRFEVRVSGVDPTQAQIWIDEAGLIDESDGQAEIAPVLQSGPVTGESTEEPDDRAVLDTDGETLYVLGDGTDLGPLIRLGSSATLVGDNWTVTVSLQDDGQAVWNALAAECYERSDSCPTGQLAIVVNDEVISAPVVQAPTFASDITISGSFDEDEAKSLARLLDFAALPVLLVGATYEPG